MPEEPDTSSIPTAQERAMRFGRPIDREAFQTICREAQEIDEKVEIRAAHSVVNGPTEDGGGTWYLPINESLFCTRRTTGTWLVEITDGEQIHGVILSNDVLLANTNRTRSQRPPEE
jgi:hypothetical protein